MHKIVLLAFFLLGTALTNAQSDSIRLSYGEETQQLAFQHMVLPGETMYAIARRYGINVHEIRWANPEISKDEKLDFQKIDIPIHKDAILYRRPLFVSDNKLIPLIYEVQPKDNLFRISRVYFSLPTPLLKKRNGLETETVSVGQNLFIGWLKQDIADIVVYDGSKANVEVLPFQEAFTVQIQEADGNVTVDKNITVTDSKGSKGLFVMHRKAKAGSYIEVENPVGHKKAYARVLANIPDHLYSKEIEMVISNELANKIGVLDNRSFLHTKYIH